MQGVHVRTDPDVKALFVWDSIGYGTGVNAPDRPGGPKAGDSTKGNCQGQFCVNDHKH